MRKNGWRWIRLAGAGALLVAAVGLASAARSAQAADEGGGWLGVYTQDLTRSLRDFNRESEDVRNEVMNRVQALTSIIGYAIRSWYASEPAEDIEVVCSRLGVPFWTSPRTNADETVEHLRRADVDLGLSLGNGMIFPKVYRVPRLGMINVHGEVLPRFQGASSVIWPIHEGVRETGFTINEVDRRIDTGRILYQERFPITLREAAGVERVDLLRFLDQHRIGTRLLFAGNIARQPYMAGRNYRMSGNLDNTDRVMRDTFWIGLYPGLTDQMLDFAAEKIEAFSGIAA